MQHVWTHLVPCTVQAADLHCLSKLFLVVLYSLKPPTYRTNYRVNLKLSYGDVLNDQVCLSVPMLSLQIQ